MEIHKDPYNLLRDKNKRVAAFAPRSACICGSEAEMAEGGDREEENHHFPPFLLRQAIKLGFPLLHILNI